MPGQNGTGPTGMGSLTGKGLGSCGSGMRKGFSRGYGRGFGFRTPLTLTKEEEKKILEAELKEIDLEKQTIETRLKEMM